MDGGVRGGGSISARRGASSPGVKKGNHKGKCFVDTSDRWKEGEGQEDRAVQSFIKEDNSLLGGEEEKGEMGTPYLFVGELLLGQVLSFVHVAIFA